MIGEVAGEGTSRGEGAEFSNLKKLPLDREVFPFVALL